jgi:hypothetical protein
VSIYLPGDVAPVHLHAPNASRTILSENGGYTTIEGERCEASRGDLILTPNGTWHDHGNDGATPVVWADILDFPLLEFLDCNWIDEDFSGERAGNAALEEIVMAIKTRGDVLPYYTNIDADPNNADIVYVGTESYYKSTDAGRTWATVTTPHGDNHDLWINPRNSAIMIQSNDGGANVSLDGGRSWSSFRQGLPHAMVYSLALDSERGGVLYAGTTAGVFRQEPGGVWSALAGDPGVPEVTALLIDHACGRLLMGTFGAGVFAAPLP